MKLPNPPVLADGNDPEFEDWDSRMRNKLKANVDHYNTEALRIAYVENRVGGKAVKHLRPRLRASAVHYCRGDAEASRDDLPGCQ